MSKLSVMYTNSEITVSSMSFDDPIGLSSNQSSGMLDSTSESSNIYLYFAIIFPVSLLWCYCLVCLVILIWFKIKKNQLRQRHFIQNQGLDIRVSNIEPNRGRIYEEDKSQNSTHKRILINFLLYLIWLWVRLSLINFIQYIFSSFLCMTKTEHLTNVYNSHKSNTFPYLFILKCISQFSLNILLLNN